MLERPSWIERVHVALGRNPVTALVGPRQVGKTTLARQFVAYGDLNYFDLEDPVDLGRFAQPMTVLAGLSGLVVIDEVQRAPHIFPVLRVLVDRPDHRAKFLLLGSAAPGLVRGSSESLAGRVEVVELPGFGLTEVGMENTARLWWRGGFPRSYLAPTDEDSKAWRRQFLRTATERDLPELGIGMPAAAQFRFLTMVAHYHGQVWNAAEPARSLGISETTVRRHLDILTNAYLVRQLPPWFENIGKRQVKAPKIYFRDSGLLHQLLNIENGAALPAHPKCGASWEGFVLEETIRRADPDAAYFWATHGGAELDLLLFKNGRRVGIEIKRIDAPRLTPSMKIAMADLKLHRLFVVYPGDRRYALADDVEAIPASELATPLAQTASLSP